MSAKGRFETLPRGGRGLAVAMWVAPSSPSLLSRWRSTVDTAAFSQRGRRAESCRLDSSILRTTFLSYRRLRCHAGSGRAQKQEDSRGRRPRAVLTLPGQSRGGIQDGPEQILSDEKRGIRWNPVNMHI